MFLRSNRVIFDFFSKKNSDLFSASFAILKSIFEKLLFLGSYQGRGKKKWVKRPRSLISPKKGQKKKL